MPKVSVNGAPEADGEPFSKVEVSWGQDSGYVQLGTVRADKHLWEMVQAGLKEAGAPLLEPDAVKVLSDALASQCGPEGFAGWFTTLTDRREVNGLIRHLRRARDGAFGRDE